MTDYSNFGIPRLTVYTAVIGVTRIVREEFAALFNVVDERDRCHRITHSQDGSVQRTEGGYLHR